MGAFPKVERQAGFSTSQLQQCIGMRRPRRPRRAEIGQGAVIWKVQLGARFMLIADPRLVHRMAGPGQRRIGGGSAATQRQRPIRPFSGLKLAPAK